METICFNNINWLSEFGIVDLKENNESRTKDLIPESLTKNCFSCGVKFTTFLNRPNLCSICSNLFCNSCIIKLKIKLCKNCLKLCQQLNQIIEKNLIQTIENGKTFLEMKETFYCKTFHDNQSFCEDFLSNDNNNFESQLLVNMNDTYELIMKTLINYVLKINFDDENIISEWKNIIYILVKETLSNLRPCSINLNDSLDINNYIKIKIIPYKDTSMCQVIQGYVLQNKKKIKNVKNNIDNPKILLLNKEIDINYNENDKDEKNNNFDDIKNNEDFQKYLLKLIENKINMIKPDIIIIGNNFPKNLFDILINNNFSDIIFIYDISNKVMKKLSRCLQTLILPSINLIGSNNILGSCKNFYIQKIENKEDINHSDNNKKSNDLFIFDGCDRLLFNTIILSGKDIELLKKIKRLLRQILIPSLRDLYLQKYIQYTLNMEINPVPEENEIETYFIEELYEESSENMPLKLDSSFNSNQKAKQKQKKSTQKLLKLSSKKTDTSKLFYEGFDLSIIEKKEDFNIYSIISLTSSQKNKSEIKNSIIEEDDQGLSEKEIHNIVNKYCESSKELNLSFFNESTDYDLPLGRFILDLCNRANEICPTCNLEYKKHTQYLYRSKGVLKIWMISGNEYCLNEIISYIKKNTKIDYSKLLPYKSDINSISERNNSDIYTYGYCNICYSIVTPLFKMNNEVINYSASKFLRFMLENHLSKNQLRNFDFNISNLIENKNCEHQINKNISRIFVTRFGSWIFEFNDIVKHYISPMYLNINDSFSKNIFFKQYEDEGYSNSINSLTLITRALTNQENYFEEISKDKKMYIFDKLINLMITIIQSVKNFNGQYMMEIINKYLKENIDKYNNSYIRLITYIKKIYLKIVKIKLIVNKIERIKLNFKIIYDILNDKMPITYEENYKLLENSDKNKEKNNDDSSNNLENLNSEINFGKDSSFRNILTFINYTDENHDYFSCEFIQDDLASFIGNVISSNDYIQSMKLVTGLNLTSIKCNRNKNDMFDNDKSKNFFRRKRRFSSLKQVQEKTNLYCEIDKGFSRRMSINIDEKKEANDLIDIMLVFNQSKNYFYIEGENKEFFTNKLIKKILEEELTSKEKEHINLSLTNDLYSLLIKKKNDEKNKGQKSEDSEKSINTNNSNNINNNINIDGVSGKEIKDKNNSSDNSLNKVDIIDEKSYFSRIEAKKDFNKISLYFKEIDKQIYDYNILFKELRDKLIDIIKNKINKDKNIKEKRELENKQSKEFNDKEKQKNKNNETNNKENNINNNDENKNHDNEKPEDIINNEKKSEENKDINPEDNLPSFQSIPEFEKISQLKTQIFFEEKLILKDPNKIEITIYYAKQFEALRIAYCSTMEEFLSSLSKSLEWSENSGGKSKASFYKTFDNKYILKNVTENEFNMFLNNGIKYFEYMSQFLFHKMPSALAKILGAYKMIIRQKNKEIRYNLILMENIFYDTISKSNNIFNSPESSIRVYDLKGSNINRYINKNMRKPGKVLLDTNFLVDFNKEPVFIDSNVYERLKIALYNDTMYLKKLEVVDYSLLIIFDNGRSGEIETIENGYYSFKIDNSFPEKGGNTLIKLGIIDYIRKYTWDKKMEFYGKSLLYGENPTIVDPNVYSDRFYKTISKYFVGI